MTESPITSPDNDQTLVDLTAAFKAQWADAQGLARKSVERAWDAGKTLTAIKARLPHGRWLPWLKAEGVSSSSAHRLMQLTKIQISQIGKFQSVDEALRSLPKPAPKPTDAEYRAAIDRAVANWREALAEATEGTDEYHAIVQARPDGLVTGVTWADVGDVATICRAYGVDQ